MTAHELIETIRRNGGFLWLSPDGLTLRYDLPSPAGETLALLRQHRDEVLAILKQRRLQGLALDIASWIRNCCVKTRRGEGNARILCREFAAWCHDEIDLPEFLDALRAAGFHVDDDGFVHGLILKVDHDAARSYSSQRVN